MMRTSGASVFLLGCLAAIGCGGSVPEAAPTSSGAAAQADTPAPRVEFSRAEVSAAVTAGLGRFLQHVDVEPSLQGGRFVGFRIVGLQPPEFWSGVDLMPGDIVTQVNGRSIERDTDAFQTFESLRTATEVRVTFLRGGQERELVYKIVGAPTASAKKSDAG